jgi:hypothetical protein
VFSTEETGTKAVEDYWNLHNPKPLKQTGWDFFYPNSFCGEDWAVKSSIFVRRDLTGGEKV